MAKPGIDVRVDRVSKSFGETRALSEVSLSALPGSVHALIGENGAGKSTLGRILAGVIQPDEGALFVNDAAVSFRSPRDALDVGIAAISQELALVPALDAAQNVLLGAEPRTMGFIRRGELRRGFLALANEVGFDLPAGVPVGAMPIAQQQQVEILRALSRDARLIVLDEPSARLSAAETEKLHAVIRSLAERGRSVLLISHHLGEVLAVADTVTVLRDGAIVRSGPTATESEASLVEAMLGRAVRAQFPDIPRPAAEAPVRLEVSGLGGTGFVDVSLQLRAGEIVGLAGLVGAGRSELAHAIVGAGPVSIGQISVDGVPRRFRAPRDALRAHLVLIPESRRDQGLFLLRSVRENISIASLSALSRFGLVDRGRERGSADARAVQIGIDTPAGTPVSALSGGNQQRILFGRALMAEPWIVVADEPTSGVDVGSKRGMYELLAAMAADGAAVLLISSEIEEILGLSHRVLVMRGGRIAAELEGEAISEEAILNAAFLAPAGTEAA
jgi:simple sugar transport system ATP-binding protein/ribose transport system ATP-binding protein